MTFPDGYGTAPSWIPGWLASAIDFVAFLGALPWLLLPAPSRMDQQINCP